MRPLLAKSMAAAALVLASAAGLAQGPPAAEQAMRLYEAGRYKEAAPAGVAVLASSPEMHELRLAVANSYAWTGHYDEAAMHYRHLFGTPYEARARIGLGNVLRWDGKSDLAEPHYRAVLAREPGNAAALQGIELSGRELRPAITARLGRTEDNQASAREDLSLGYRAWSADRRWRYELGVDGGSFDTPQGSWQPRGLHGSLWARQLPLSPKIEATLYDSGARGTRAFGIVQVEPLREAVRLRAGRVDWGRLAFSGGGTRDGLTAVVFGAAGEASTPLGKVRGRLDRYAISDDNHVMDAEALVTPRWQPLPWNLQWFTGLYGRKAEREDPRYWSPNPGYGLAFLGLQRGWYYDRSEITLSARRGFGFTDTARHSWGAGLSARYWLGRNLAIGLEGWAVETPRPAPYRMRSLGVFVQHLL